MGRRCTRVSSFGSDFNRDFHVTFTQDEVHKGEMYYNYHLTKFPSTEGPGISVLYKDESGDIYHTYSCYARGLDMLNKLQNSPTTEVEIDDTPPPGLDPKTEVDQKLVAFSKNCDGRLVTNDYNLNKVAKLRGVDVININSLANALKTIVLPGEPRQTKILKSGEEADQGIGYLEDGTMIVVEDARNRIGETIILSVTSSLQTAAGKMIFGKYERTVEKSRNSYDRSNNKKQYNKRPNQNT